MNLSSLYPGVFAGPQASDLSTREKGRVILFRRVEDNEHLECHIIETLRKWAETVSDVNWEELVLIPQGKIPEPEASAAQE